MDVTQTEPRELHRTWPQLIIGVGPQFITGVERTDGLDTTAVASAGQGSICGTDLNVLRLVCLSVTCDCTPVFFSSGLGETDDALRLVERFEEGQEFQLKNNPWVMPPEAVVEAGLPATKRYLLDVQEAKAGADVTSLQLLKVVLVGSAGAGKTRWDVPRNNDTLACTFTSQTDSRTTLIHI